MSSPANFDDSYSPRLNFNNFAESFVANFVVIVLDGWNTVMYDVYRTSENKVRARDQFYLIYFILLVILGNMILLNLFLAVLINNFVQSREHYREDTHKQLLTYSLQAWAAAIRAHLKALQHKTSKILNGGAPSALARTRSKELEARLLRPPEAPRGCAKYLQSFDLGLFPLSLQPSPEDAAPETADGVLARKYSSKAQLAGTALFLFSPTNRFRRFLFRWVHGNRVRNLFLCLGVFSSAIMVFLDPLSSPRSGLNLALVLANKFFGFFFLGKMLLDCATFGLAFNGEESYLRHGMHVLELMVNVCFLLYVFGGVELFATFGAFRLVYALELSELFVYSPGPANPST